ncbi:MAG: alkaline phosphatase, partial [Verrucomicrobiae bacterium]|nr:alkaline phosphatase [Verrucomicrobiae bacterium]
ICGDRHWQYHSVHPGTGVQEFSVGAASDSHAGGTPGYDANIHRFHRVKGGFLSVDVNREGGESTIAFRLRDVNGEVGYEALFRRAVS